MINMIETQYRISFTLLHSNEIRGQFLFIIRALKNPT